MTYSAQIIAMAMEISECPDADFERFASPQVVHQARSIEMADAIRRCAGIAVDVRLA